MCRPDDFPPFELDAVCVRGTCRGCRRTVNLAAHDCPEPARAAHASRTAGRSRRVLYLEAEDVPPPADPEDWR